jgi:Ca2+-binding EF-hand superfamily protein
MCGMTSYLRRILILLATLPLMAVAQTPNSAPPASDPRFAQTESPQDASERQANEAQYMQWFNLLDLNHDGCVSREEAQTAIQRMPLLALWEKKLMRDFDEADADHKGCITPDDIRALTERRHAEREARRAAQARQKADEQATEQPAAPSSAPQPAVTPSNSFP